MTSGLVSQEACEATLLTTSAAVAYSSLAGIRQLSGLLSMSGEILVEAEPVKREQAETYI
jgi:hypothetical protein